MSALENRDKSSAPFTVGTYVHVRCLVTAIDTFGSGAKVTCLVETPGNVGEISGVSFQVSPVQCKKAGSTEQA